jgi:hypothetical protein
MSVTWNAGTGQDGRGVMKLWHLTFVCWWRGHDVPIWTFSAQGIGWTCPTCGRFRVSPVLKELA